MSLQKKKGSSLTQADLIYRLKGCSNAIALAIKAECHCRDGHRRCNYDLIGGKAQIHNLKKIAVMRVWKRYYRTGLKGRKVDYLWMRFIRNRGNGVKYG